MSYAYQCTDCDYSQPMPFFPSLRGYLAGEGIVLPLAWHYDWCEHCDRMTATEAFDVAKLNGKAEDTEHLLAKLGAQPRWRFWQTAASARRRFIEWRREDIVLRNKLVDIRILLEAIRDRKVGPRCLDCGWSAMHPPASNGVPAEPVHAGCGGLLRRKELGRANGRTKQQMWYDLQGEFIEVVEADFSKDVYHEHFENARLRGEYVPDEVMPPPR